MTQHSRIAELVSRTSALTITLENSAPAGVENLLAAIAGVSDAEAIGEDRSQIRVQFDSAQETEVHVGVLQALSNAGIAFKDMSRGESLESRVREITR